MDTSVSSPSARLQSSRKADDAESALDAAAFVIYRFTGAGRRC
jgi:hypothetical protein